VTQRAILVCCFLCASIAASPAQEPNTSPGQRSVSQDISYSQLLDDVDQGKVLHVYIRGSEIHGTYTDGRDFHTDAPDDLTLVQRLYNGHVSITALPLKER
jgi:cell division protease FtsH